MEGALELRSATPTSTGSTVVAEIERARRELTAAIEFVALVGGSLVLANLPGIERALADMRESAARRGIELEPERREDGVGIDVRIRRR